MKSFCSWKVWSSSELEIGRELQSMSLLRTRKKLRSIMKMFMCNRKIGPCQIWGIVSAKSLEWNWRPESLDIVRFYMVLTFIGVVKLPKPPRVSAAHLPSPLPLVQLIMKSQDSCLEEKNSKPNMRMKPIKSSKTLNSLQKILKKILIWSVPFWIFIIRFWIEDYLERLLSSIAISLTLKRFHFISNDLDPNPREKEGTRRKRSLSKISSIFENANGWWLWNVDEWDCWY